jgi:hypothetical protein
MYGKVWNSRHFSAPDASSAEGTSIAPTDIEPGTTNLEPNPEPGTWNLDPGTCRCPIADAPAAS